MKNKRGLLTKRNNQNLMLNLSSEAKMNRRTRKALSLQSLAGFRVCEKYLRNLDRFLRPRNYQTFLPLSSL